MQLRKIVPFLLLFCLTTISQSQINYYEHFTDKVLRIDLLRSGYAGNENLAINAMLEEEFWSGCRNKTIVPFEYGDFKVEVRDITETNVLFSFTYSSLFSEYIFTEKGKYEYKTFQESVRIPYPKHAVKIIFYHRDKLTHEWKVELKKDFQLSAKPERLQPVITNARAKKIHDSGPPEKKTDIAFIAEGYTREEQMKFFDDAVRISEYLFNCQPFTEYSDKINIWAVFYPSDESGVTDPAENMKKNTALGCNFSTFGTDRYLMTEQHFQLRNIAATVPYDHLIIIVNSNKYGGGGIYNFYATCTADHSATDFLVVHEFGHSFAGLADEYWTSDVSVNEYYSLHLEPVEPNITTLIDFDAKWKNMIAPDTPIPTPNDRKYKNVVGVFEGGGYVEKGIYRPFLDCTMKSAKYNAFCPVCRETIKRIIEFYSE